MMPKMGTQGGVTPAEIEDCRRRLEQSRDGVIAATARLSEVQWNYRPASGGWTVAGLVEHMVLIQEVVLGPIWQTLMESPASEEEDAETVDALAKTAIPDRSRKAQAPERVHPAGRWTPAESLARLSENTQRLIERLESTPDLRLHRSFSPPLNVVTDGRYSSMDGYQWLLAAAGHNVRHTAQIEEVKAEPGFPSE